MAQIDGTTGNDNLVGTEFDDVINALTGFDTVDGAGGYDTLIVDYSAFVVPTARFPSLVVLDAAGLSGTIESRVANDFVQFSNIEKLDVSLGSRADWFIFRADVPLAGQVLNVDGGTGFGDRLSLFLGNTANVAFTVDAALNVSNNLGFDVSGFEQFEISAEGGGSVFEMGASADRITVGGGGNDVSTGEGSDLIATDGGSDMIDGGSDPDTWTINMLTATTGVTLVHNGLAGTASLSTGANAVSVETVNASLGTGDDTITFIDASYAVLNSTLGNDTFIIVRPTTLDIQGDEGTDSVTIDMSGTVRFSDTELLPYFSGGFSGSVSRYNGVELSGIEHLDITLSDADDLVKVDLKPLLTGSTLKLNGGVGTDFLVLDFSSFASGRATVAADGSLTIAGGIFTGIEGYRFVGSAGNDHFTGGSSSIVIDSGDGDDVLRGGAGDDTMNGGAGKDKLYANGGADTLIGGDGNDSYYIDVVGYLETIVENAREGTDTVYSSVGAVLSANVERLVLTGSGDVAGLGNELNNMISGNGGDNMLEGSGGKDVIKGGYDTLTGGADADEFQFDRKALDGGIDQITDFSSAERDKISLKSIDADGAGGAANGIFAFIGTAVFGNVKGQLRYEVTGGDAIVLADINGDGVADLAISVLGVTSLVEGDFLL